jgi:hypothetical protein
MIRSEVVLINGPASRVHGGFAIPGVDTYTFNPSQEELAMDFVSVASR